MSVAQRLVRKLDQLVRHARANVRLYQEMYGGFSGVRSLDDFAKLPVLNRVLLGSEKLEKTFGDAAQLCVTRTFEDEPRAGGHVPRLLSYEDALGEYDVLRFLMRRVAKRVKHKIMLVADERHIYAMAELGKQLAYYEWPLATFIVRDGNIDRLCTYLAWFQPTLVFLDSRLNLSARTLPGSVKFLFTFNRWGRRMIDLTSSKSFARLDILKDTWVGIMAISDNADGLYGFDPNHFYFEVSPDGALLATSFIYRLQPVIRYELPLRGFLVGRTGFALR